jgi:hypothetical protein
MSGARDGATPFVGPRVRPPEKAPPAAQFRTDLGRILAGARDVSQTRLVAAGMLGATALAVGLRAVLGA